MQQCAWLEGGVIRCWGNGLLTGYGNVGGETCTTLPYEDLCGVNAACCIGDQPSEMPPPPVQYL